MSLLDKAKGLNLLFKLCPLRSGKLLFQMDNPEVELLTTAQDKLFSILKHDVFSLGRLYLGSMRASCLLPLLLAEGPAVQKVQKSVETQKMLYISKKIVRVLFYI